MLNVGGTIPWAGVPDQTKRRRWADHKHASSLPPAVDTMWTASSCPCYPAVSIRMNYTLKWWHNWTLALKNDIDNFWLCVSPLPLVPLAPHSLWSIHFSFFKTQATSYSAHETSPSFSGPHVSVSKHPLSSMRFNIQLSCVFFYHQCYIYRYT